MTLLLAIVGGGAHEIATSSRFRGTPRNDSKKGEIATARFAGLAMTSRDEILRFAQDDKRINDWAIVYSGQSGQ